MERWMHLIVGIIVAAAIVALVIFARGEPGRDELTQAATALGILI